MRVDCTRNLHPQTLLKFQTYFHMKMAKKPHSWGSALKKGGGGGGGGGGGMNGG